MAIAEKISSGVSRRALLTGGLAGGFLLAFHLPVRRGQRARGAARYDRRKIRSQRLHSHRPDRSHHAGDAPGRDGTRHLYRGGDDPGRRTRCRSQAGDRRARPRQREALREPRLRHAGDRRLHFGPGLLDAVAQRRRQRARHAGAGRGGAMAGFAGKLHHVERGSDACRERTQGFLRRDRDCRGQPDAAQGRRPQGPEEFRHHRHAAEAFRHAREGQRQGRLRYRCDASGHEVRNAEGLSGIRRQGRQGRRQRREKDPGRAADRRARRPGRRGRRSHVGRQEGRRRAGHRLG